MKRNAVMKENCPMIQTRIGRLLPFAFHENGPHSSIKCGVNKPVPVVQNQPLTV
jgi:hypothetical protein